MNTATKPSLSDLAIAADDACRAYDVAARADRTNPSERTWNMFQKAREAKNHALAAHEKETYAMDRRVESAIRGAN